MEQVSCVACRGFCSVQLLVVFAADMQGAVDELELLLPIAGIVLLSYSAPPTGRRSLKGRVQWIMTKMTDDLFIVEP